MNTLWPADATRAPDSWNSDDCTNPWLPASDCVVTSNRCHSCGGVRRWSTSEWVALTLDVGPRTRSCVVRASPFRPRSDQNACTAPHSHGSSGTAFDGTDPERVRRRWRVPLRKREDDLERAPTEEGEERPSRVRAHVGRTDTRHHGQLPVRAVRGNRRDHGGVRDQLAFLERANVAVLQCPAVAHALDVVLHGRPGLARAEEVGVDRHRHRSVRRGQRGGGERLGHHLSSEEPAALDAAEVGEAGRDTVGAGLHADGQVHAFQTHWWSLARVAVIRQSSEIEVGRDLLRVVVPRRDILGAKASGGDEVVDTAAVRVRVRRRVTGTARAARRARTGATSRRA